MHSATPILPSCNYCGIHAHKVNECNILSEDLFCDYCGKEGHQEAVCFAKFPKRKQFRLPWQNLLTSFVAPQPKAKAPQLSTHVFPTKGNSNKNAKKKEHNASKREVFQAHVVQVQSLQNEFELFRAQFTNLKNKSSQLANHAQIVQGSESHYTYFFQSICLFHFLFILNEFKSYGGEIWSFKNDFWSAKKLDQCVYILSFKMKNYIFCV